MKGDQAAVVALLTSMDDFVSIIHTTHKKQIKLIKNGEIGTRNSLLYLSLVGELKNVGWYASRNVNAYLDLVEGQNEPKTKEGEGGEEEKGKG